MNAAAVEKAPQKKKLRVPASVLPYVAALLLVVAGSWVSPGFAAPNHLLLILNLAAFLGFAAAGQSVVIMSGGIDLSVSSVITLAGVVSATLMNGSDEGLAVAAAVSIAIGVLIGAINGAGIAFLGIHPMVMTLGMTSIAQGAALIYTNGAPKGSAAPLLRFIATGRVFGGLPIVVLLWAAAAAFLILAMHGSVWGRRLYALGNSPKAAFYSGIRVSWMQVSLYVISGFSAALTGVLLTGYTRTSYLTIGDPYQMNSIAAVVIGGSSILGGKGSYIGTVAGCVIIVLLQSILPILSVPEAGRRIIFGVLVLALLLLYGRGAKRRA